jgi:hypothetical protein
MVLGNVGRSEYLNGHGSLARYFCQEIFEENIKKYQEKYLPALNAGNYRFSFDKDIQWPPPLLHSSTIRQNAPATVVDTNPG